MLKKCKVVMLPTEKAEGCLLKGFKTLQHHPKEFFTQEYLKSSNRHSEHLYILSDDKIKDNDWCYSEALNLVYQVKKLPLSAIDSKKIIAATDTSLTIDIIPTGFKSGIGALSHKQTINLPQPSKSFIQKYVEEYNKGNIITEVMVEYEEILEDEGIIKSLYGEDWKLKINPKDNTITIRPVKNVYTKQEIIELINKELIEFDTPSGFKAVYKTNLLNLFKI